MTCRTDTTFYQQVTGSGKFEEAARGTTLTPTRSQGEREDRARECTPQAFSRKLRTTLCSSTEVLVSSLASDVMRDSLRLLEEREEIRATEIDNLKHEYAEGKASGEPEDVDPVQFLKDLKAERARRA